MLFESHCKTLSYLFYVTPPHTQVQPITDCDMWYHRSRDQNRGTETFIYFVFPLWIRSHRHAWPHLDRSHFAVWCVSVCWHHHPTSNPPLNPPSVDPVPRERHRVYSYEARFIRTSNPYNSIRRAFDESGGYRAHDCRQRWVMSSTMFSTFQRRNMNQDKLSGEWAKVQRRNMNHEPRETLWRVS